MPGVTASRQPKLSREEIHTLLVDVGRTILREEGMGTGAEALTFKRVLERVERDHGVRLTNASIIKRVWDNQADFQTDVLVAIAADEGITEFEQTLDALTEVFATVDLSTPEGRWSSVREICRVGGAANMDALADSANWPSWIGVWTLTTSSDRPAVPDRIERALAAGYQSFTAHFEKTYLAMADYVGIRLKGPLTIRQFTIAVGALAEGCVLRTRVDADNMEGLRLPTGPEGELQEWTLFSIGLDALVRQFFELIPDWDPPDG
jgi:hypothetical protein